MDALSRFLVNAVCLVAIGMIAAGLGWVRYDEDLREDSMKKTIAEVQRFDQMVDLRAATKDVALSDQDWPTVVEPEWFKGEPPVNHMVSLDRPWVEVATPEQADLKDPPTRVAIGKETASFWYNPANGVIRARVPMTISDEETIRLYNRINATSIDVLFAAQSEAVKAELAPVLLALATPTAERKIKLAAASSLSEGDARGLGGFNPMALRGTGTGIMDSSEEHPAPSPKAKKTKATKTPTKTPTKTTQKTTRR
jgi:hypothetical protein